MIDIIPSKQMKEYLNEIGFTFSDHQKATLIWNSDSDSYSWNEKLNALRELAEQTSDTIVKQQVLERVQYEEKCFDVFHDNSSNRYIYIVSNMEEREEYSLKSEPAISYAKRQAIKNKEEYTVYKQLLLTEAKPSIIKSNIQVNPNIFGELEFSEEEKYNGGPIANLTINPNGEIAAIYSNELSKEEDDQVSIFKQERFEDKFIPIVFPFEKGDIVKHIPTGEYAVVKTSQEQWKQFLEKVEQGLYVDYIDTSITVVFLDKEGYWSHDHLNPLDFEIDVPEVTTENELFCQALEALSEYWRGDCGKGEVVLRLCKEYAKSKKEEDFIKSSVENAKTIKDILW